MNEKNRYRLPRMQERTFIRRPFQHVSVLDRITVLQLGLHGWNWGMKKEDIYKRYKERLANP